MLFVDLEAGSRGVAGITGRADQQWLTVCTMVATVAPVPGLHRSQGSWLRYLVERRVEPWGRSGRG